MVKAGMPVPWGLLACLKGRLPVSVSPMKTMRQTQKKRMSCPVSRRLVG